MIMIILEYVCVEIVRGWYIDSAIKEKKTSRDYQPFIKMCFVVVELLESTK